MSEVNNLYTANVCQSFEELKDEFGLTDKREFWRYLQLSSMTSFWKRVSASVGYVQRGIWTCIGRFYCHLEDWSAIGRVRQSLILIRLPVFNWFNAKFGHLLHFVLYLLEKWKTKNKNSSIVAYGRNVSICSPQTAFYSQTVGDDRSDDTAVSFFALRDLSARSSSAVDGSVTGVK